MAMKDRNAKTRKLDPHADYVLKSAPPEDPLLSQFHRVQYVSAYRDGVKASRDFSKAVKFKGAWLNDTCWFFEIFWQAVQYEIEKINAQKSKTHESVQPAPRSKVHSPGRDRHAGVRAKALDRPSGDAIRAASKPDKSKRRLESEKNRKPALGRIPRARPL